MIGKETLQFGIGYFWIVGAVFNRDYPGNRGWKPLPPTINYSLNDIELNVVSYERFRVGRLRIRSSTPPLAVEAASLTEKDTL